MTASEPSPLQCGGQHELGDEPTGMKELYDERAVGERLELCSMFGEGLDEAQATSLFGNVVIKYLAHLGKGAARMMNDGHQVGILKIMKRQCRERLRHFNQIPTVIVKLAAAQALIIRAPMMQHVARLTDQSQVGSELQELLHCGGTAPNQSAFRRAGNASCGHNCCHRHYRLGPCGPLALRDAKPRYNPAAIVDRIGHATSPVSMQGIVGRGCG